MVREKEEIHDDITTQITENIESPPPEIVIEHPDFTGVMLRLLNGGDGVSDGGMMKMKERS